MKHKLKTLACLFFILTLFTSCQDDDDVTETGPDQDIISRTLSFSELPHLNQVRIELEGVRATFNRRATTESGQAIRSSIPGAGTDNISILTEKVLYMTYAETHTYTFTLLRNNPEYYIENVVLHYNLKTESYDEYLVQYIVTEDEFLALNEGELFADEFDTIITRLDVGTINDLLIPTSSSGSCSYQCQTINVDCTGDLSHEYGEDCPKTGDDRAFQYQSCGTVCSDDGNNPIEGFDDAPPPTGNGGSGAVNTNPVSGQPCTISGGTSGLIGTNGSCIPVLTPEEALNELLDENPFLLLDIDCNQIQNWQNLAQNQASQTIKDKIDGLPSTIFNDFEIQDIENANGPIVNLDYFPVNISTLPNNPNSGQQFSPEGFLDYFRRNINDFVSGSGTTFEPYCRNVSPSICQQETDLWNSNDPTGALIYLNIPVDDGVVICSEFQHDYWYFMTMNAPYAGNHPVSGTRQFGYETNADGSYNFFVRGADRMNSLIQFSLVSAFANMDPLVAADVLWYTFQENMNNFVNDNGGISTIPSASINRPNWNEVEDVLLGIRPISDLGCN